MANITPDNASNNSIELISAQTAGATSESFIIPEGEGFTIFSDALTGAETVGVEAEKPDGTWVEIKSDLLSSSGNEAAFYSKGKFRLVKSATAGAVGVYAFNRSFMKSGRR